MSRGSAIVCCTTESALRDLLDRAPAVVVQLRVLPLPSMFPRDLRDAVAELPYEVTCAVAPPGAAERLLTGAGAQDRPRLGQALVFAGRQLLGRVDGQSPDRDEMLLRLLRAGLSPALPPGRWGEEGGDPFKVLGVPPSASLDEVRSAWRRRIAEHHPDRFMLADEQRRRLAVERSQRFNAAFKAIRRLRDQST